MQKLLILTDLHITAGGAEIIGLDPWARFEAALEDALAHHSDSDVMILSGDLTHHGQPAAYHRLAERLKDVPMPMLVLPGNHDRRTPMAASFPEHMADDGFFHRIIDLDRFRLIGLDTLDEAAPDKHSGILCPARLDWLSQALQTEKDVIVFTHHPLARTGFDGMDAIGLRNTDEVSDRLAAAQVKLVLSGHIHRTISGVWRGVPFAMVKSPCHQMPLMLGPGSSDLSSDEPGGFGVVLLEEDGIIVHTADTGFTPSVSRDSASAT